jgi:hypothetical protein
MIKFSQYITEADKALQKKADKSGISYGTLKKVFDRGVCRMENWSQARHYSVTVGVCPCQRIYCKEEKRWSQPR